MSDSYEDKPPNGGHHYGIEFPDNYYYADAVRINEFGALEWYCVYDDHCQKGLCTADGIVLDFEPDMTLEEFQKLNGNIGAHQ